MKEICEILEDVSLKNYNTYRIDTKTKYLALPSSVEELKGLLEYLNKNKEITVAQFRDITKSNRKISIVMLEHFDRNRITKRVEDKRILY